MNKNCGIYKITSPSGRVYIGQSKDFERRVKEYKNLTCKGQKLLYRSLKKYSFENHQFDIIEYCSVDELNCSERFWQDEFDVLGKNGLNCILTECGDKIKVWSEEMKKRQSDNMKGELNHFYGKKHSEESNQKNREAKIGKKQSKKTIAKRVEKMKGELHPFYGKNRSKEVSKKISDTRINNKIAVGEKNPMYGRIGELHPNFGKKIDLLKADNIILDTQTGIFYYSYTEAAETIGMHKTTLRSQLIGQATNKTNFILTKDE